MPDATDSRTARRSECLGGYFARHKEENTAKPYFRRVAIGVDSALPGRDCCVLVIADWRKPLDDFGGSECRGFRSDRLRHRTCRLLHCSRILIQAVCVGHEQNVWIRGSI